MDTTKIRNAALAASAVAAALVAWAFVPRAVETWKLGVVEASAQEAVSAAVDSSVVVVEQMTAPMVKAQEQTVDLLRRNEDRELLDRCESRADRRGEHPDDYEMRCEAESEARWEYWMCEDEADDPAVCDEP